MYQLMHDDILDNSGRQLHHPPMEVQRPICAARAPPVAAIPNHTSVVLAVTLSLLMLAGSVLPAMARSLHDPLIRRVLPSPTIVFLTSDLETTFAAGAGN